MRDSGEVIKLVEELRRAILVYQVSVRHHQSRKSLTRGTGVTTAVHIQPGRPFDCEFLPLVFDCEAKPVAGRTESAFDALLKVHQVSEHGYSRRCRITYLQTSPVKNKIESVRARLDRLLAGGDVAKDADEFKRTKNLYECVFFVHCEERPALNRSQSSRGDQGQVTAST
jgi:hypothetical protein